jgi:hypothetical protein
MEISSAAQQIKLSAADDLCRYSADIHKKRTPKYLIQQALLIS